MATKLGFVGVGRMGGHMTSRLLDAGYALTVFDTNAEATKPIAERGATVAGSPAEVASDVETVLMCLPMPDIVRTVAIGEGGVMHGSKVRTLIDLSTTGPTIAGIVAREIGKRKITLVDAPVSGGVAGAKAGTLAVMVSCPKATYPQVEPILKTFGKLFYTGEKPGLAQIAKLGNNLLAAAAHGGLVGGAGDGRQGRHRPAGDDRHHQRRQRPQQRHAGQVPALDPAAAPSISASPPASPTRTCGCASTRPRRSACRWWWARPCGRCWR